MDIIAIIGLAVAVVALAIPFIVEAIKRPRLEIVPSEWSPRTFVPWTFATVRVHNKPIATSLIKKILLRQSAPGCRVELEYYHWDKTTPFLRIDGRWSSVREPLRFVPPDRIGVADPFSSTPLTGVGPPVTGGTAPTTPLTGVAPPVTAGTAPTTYQFEPPRSGTARTEPQYKVFYDPSLSPRQLDVPVSPDGEQIAVAILRNDEAYAFSTESYNHPIWGKPDWRLELGKTYGILVRIRGSSIQNERKFKLEYLTNDVSKFRLEAIDSKKTT